jgi:hypothetical protein
MAKTAELARVALAKDQVRREMYYNKRVKHTTDFEAGDRVWVLKPPRGRGITKLTHQWVGPAKIRQDTGFDNWEVVREDTGEHLIVHCSFLVSCRCPSDSLGSVADKIIRDLAEDDAVAEAGGRATRRPGEDDSRQGAGASSEDELPAERAEQGSQNQRSGRENGAESGAVVAAQRQNEEDVGQQSGAAPGIAERRDKTARGPVEQGRMTVLNRPKKRRAEQHATADDGHASSR